jgi:DNA mismatch endonuclease (patch repair protein)
MMSGIRGTNTKPELAIRRGLHAAGFRYRLHAKDVPGRPDIVLPRYRAAIFVNGCFWHGHDCHLFRLPGTREEFWQDKINRNRQRDAEVEAVLAAAGWRRLTIWECALRGRTKIGLEDAVACTIEWIRGDSLSAELRGMS